VQLALPFLLWSLLGTQQAASPTDEELQRERREKVTEVIQALELKEGQSVADVGAGSGLYAVRLARVVGPAGRVYAEDISEGALKRLRERIAKEKLNNVTAILGGPDDPRLPLGALDAVLIVNAYHEMEKPKEMLQQVFSALKPAARIVMVDLMPGKTRKRPRAEQVKDHRLAPELAETELRETGFEILLRVDDFVDWPDEEVGRWMIIGRRPL